MLLIIIILLTMSFLKSNYSGKTYYVLNSKSLSVGDTFKIDDYGNLKDIHFHTGYNSGRYCTEVVTLDKIKKLFDDYEMHNIYVVTIDDAGLSTVKRVISKNDLANYKQYNVKPRYRVVSKYILSKDDSVIPFLDDSNIVDFIKDIQDSDLSVLEWLQCNSLLSQPIASKMLISALMSEKINHAEYLYEITKDLDLYYVKLMIEFGKIKSLDLIEKKLGNTLDINQYINSILKSHYKTNPIPCGPPPMSTEEVLKITNQSIEWFKKYVTKYNSKLVYDDGDKGYVHKSFEPIYDDFVKFIKEHSF